MTWMTSARRHPLGVLIAACGIAAAVPTSADDRITAARDFSAAQPQPEDQSPAIALSPETEVDLGLTLDERVLIQRGLTALRLDAGADDGLFGHKTRRAIRRYQVSVGADATGYLTNDQAKALMDRGREVRVAAGIYPGAAPLGLGLVKIGQSFKDCPDCPEMIVIPPGSFMMGSPEDEAERLESEGPQRRVTIARAFGVGKHEVTFAEWDACVANGGCNGYRPSDHWWGRGRRPVINVSWRDAQAYVEWLSRRTGNKYRLLSESEWEYAARAGTTTAFGTGETITTDQANFDGSHAYAEGVEGVYRRQTVPVGSYAPNEYGLHDMHGNVREWVEDCWNPSYLGAPEDERAWDKADCRLRVVRGGSWILLPHLIRSASRSWAAPGYRILFTGFRVARALD